MSRRKIPPLKPAGLLKPIEPPKVPFEQVGMDLLGPFPVSSSGNRWIIVATDYMTRYAETSSLPKGTANEVAHFFVKQVVLRHGAPKILITDKGTAFTICNETYAYHPQKNYIIPSANKRPDGTAE